MWYRGRLEAFDPATNRVRVEFVDFGNSDQVRLDQVTTTAYGQWVHVAEFIDPDWEDTVNSGKGLSYRPARLHGLAGVDFIPQSRIYEFGY